MHSSKLRMGTSTGAVMLLTLLCAAASAQVTITYEVRVPTATPIPPDAKVTYVWTADAGLVVRFTLGDSVVPVVPTPPVIVVPPSTLRDLVTAEQAKTIAEYFRAFAGQVSSLKSVAQFWAAYDATFPVKGNAALDKALKARLDKALETTTGLSTRLLVLASEFEAPIPPTPPPVIPPSTTGPRQVVIIHETADLTPRLNSLIVKLRTGTAADYIKKNGHKLAILDDELAGKWTDLLRPKFVGMPLPALFILDPKTNAVLYQQSLTGDTADQVIERLRENGG